MVEELGLGEVVFSSFAVWAVPLLNKAWLWELIRRGRLSELIRWGRLGSLSAEDGTGRQRRERSWWWRNGRRQKCKMQRGDVRTFKEGVLKELTLPLATAYRFF